MTAFTKQASQQAKKELAAAGWEHIATVCSDTAGLRYGSHFLKQGAEFFLNKDTFMTGMTGDQMAEACRPIFNR